jgi:uncharacterized LabA/DUF88 family protein
MTLPKRAVALVDGFNLYHAIEELHAPHLKWVDLWNLCERLVGKNLRLDKVLYFSAFATWRPDAYKRHRAYVAALEHVGVQPIMGQFKQKDRRCNHCGTRWIAHEEKETDVNIALHLLNLAYKDCFDCALLISNDSDLAPAVRMLKTEFPNKWVRIITPPKKRTSKELVQAAGGMTCVRTLKEKYLADSLLPASIASDDGLTIERPDEYRPPQ